MNILDCQLHLSYSPLTIYEFDKRKNEIDTRESLSSASVYMICKRPLPIMRLVEGAADRIELGVTMEGIKEEYRFHILAKDNPELALDGFAAINGGTNNIHDKTTFHHIDLYSKCGDTEKITLMANFDRLVYLSFHEDIRLCFKEHLPPEYITYQVLYVGECVGEHICDRFKAHHALQNILINERAISKDYDKVDDLVLLPFYIESDCISTFTGNEDEDEFIDTMMGKLPYNGKMISLDCEKAFVKAMQPKYNRTKFKSFPKSKDGLYNHKLAFYQYTICESLVLSYGEQLLYGDIKREANSVLQVSQDDWWLVE